MNKIKISIVAVRDLNGGGFKASHRLYKQLRKYIYNVDLLVQNKISSDPIITSLSSKFDKVRFLLRNAVSRYILNLQRSSFKTDHTLALFSSGMGKKIERNDYDIINLHWVAGEMMSIKEIGNMCGPVVWTLHDMWAFTGTEHYNLDLDESSRWRSGYYKTNRRKEDSGFDLDRLAWLRKRKYLNSSIHIITPSNWLKSCVENSKLMKDFSVSVVPNIIDIDLFKPLNKEFCRKSLNLNTNKKIILFGAFAGTVNKIKGYDLLTDAISNLPEDFFSECDIVVFGQDRPKENTHRKFDKIIWMGQIFDEYTLPILYGCADVVVVPSRLEAFGLVAAEAQSCGIPVVAFDAAGLKDVVEHKITGFLAKPYDANELSDGILWVLSNSDRFNSLSAAARKKACAEWSPEVIIPKYIDIYTKVIEKNNKREKIL